MTAGYITAPKIAIIVRRSFRFISLFQSLSLMMIDHDSVPILWLPNVHLALTPSQDKHHNANAKSLSHACCPSPADVEEAMLCKWKWENENEFMPTPMMPMAKR